MNWNCFQIREADDMNCKIANRHIATISVDKLNTETLGRDAWRWVVRYYALPVIVIFSACANTPIYEAPRVDASASTQALKKLPRKQGDLVAVSIYEFRSAVGEIAVRGATDMFKTALVQSGQFRVVERARLNEGVIREKQLNASGLSSGTSATEVLTGAKYIFEGAITQANAGETQRAGVLRIAGAELGASSNRDVIGIDVRVVNVGTSEIVGVVTVSKAITSDSTSLSGIGNLIGTVLLRKGKSSANVPDLQVQQQRKESIDVALRAAIDESVLELSRRFAP
jgi:curli biogenesis system outer membrane secretion channel CsgG